jgi:BlaI family transcriptional regulator, penicillinase repressor
MDTTMVYRLEGKKAIRSLIDDLLAFFGGRSQPVMAHLIESGQLTLDDVREAEKALRRRFENS